MKGRHQFACALAVTLVAAANSEPHRITTPEIQLQPVGPGIYAALQPFENRFNDSNSAVIVGDNSAIVIDTQTTLTVTRAVIEEIQKVTTKPVLYVVNTHWHGDHVQGNQAYRDAFPGVLFVAHQNTREDMQNRTAAELKDAVANLPGQIERYKQMLAVGHGPDSKPLSDDQKRLLEMRVRIFSAQLPDLRQTQIVLPDIAFDGSMTIYQGSREIRLLHYPGHTSGDIVAYLPSEKVLISGDLLDDMPYTGDGSPTALAATLAELDKLDFSIVIPGHGAIERGHEHLRLVKRLFDSIVSQVRASVAARMSLEETKKSVNVEQFRLPMTASEEHAVHAFDGWVTIAVERCYLEMKGNSH